VQASPAVSRAQDGTNRKSGITFGFPWPYVFAAILIVTGIFVYRAWNHGSSQPGQTSGEPKQTTEEKGKPTEAVTPIALPAPPFDYTLTEAHGEDAKIRIEEVSEKPNQITDEEEWFGSNDLAMPTLTVPNPYKQEAGNIPAQIPTRQGADEMLIKAIKQENYLLCIYGQNFASGRYLTIFDLNTGKVKFAFDFLEYMHPPKYLNADRDFVSETVNWAVLKSDIVYVSNGHSTYARSSYGQNAYLTAIDAKTGRMLWRSAPLVSNSANFLLFEGAIITGYGFTAEPHFLYLLNQKDGQVVQTIKLKKSASYILRKGDDIYVRGYDTDYMFRAKSQQAGAKY
jgi:hypothetical protein